MAKVKAPFSNGMTEDEVVVYLKSVMPAKRGPNGGAIKTKYEWSEGDLVLRNQLIIYWLTKEGYSRVEVAMLIMQKFDVARGTAFKWAKEAVETLNEGFDEYRDAARQIQIERIEKCIKECKGSGKLKEAAMFTEQLNKIYGLYTDTKKVEVSADGPIKFEFDKS